MIRKALLFGVAGTLGYAGIVAAAALATGKHLNAFASPTDPVAQIALLPLLPALLPGFLITGKLWPGALLSAPLVNTALVYLWLRRRERQHSDCCG